MLQESWIVKAASGRNIKVMVFSCWTSILSSTGMGKTEPPTIDEMLDAYRSMETRKLAKLKAR